MEGILLTVMQKILDKVWQHIFMSLLGTHMYQKSLTCTNENVKNKGTYSEMGAAHNQESQAFLEQILPLAPGQEPRLNGKGEEEAGSVILAAPRVLWHLGEG